MLTHVNGAIATKSKELTKELLPFAVEASWKLGKWEPLETLLSNPLCEETFEVNLGKILLSIKKKDREQFSQLLGQTRESLMAPLAAASMESYSRTYPFIVKLHMLRELEAGFYNWFGDSQSSEVLISEKILADWESRLKVTPISFKIREGILNLRRVILELRSHLSKPQSSKMKEQLNLEIGNCWIQAAKVARKNRFLQTSYATVIQASNLNVPTYHLERAKCLWDEGKLHKAMIELKNGLTQLEKNKNTSSPVYNKVFLFYFILFYFISL